MEKTCLQHQNTKKFYFDFDLPKNVDNTFKHEIEFIIKNN